MIKQFSLAIAFVATFVLGFFANPVCKYVEAKAQAKVVIVAPDYATYDGSYSYDPDPAK